MAHSEEQMRLVYLHLKPCQIFTFWTFNPLKGTKKKKKNQRNYKYTNTGRIESFGCKQRLRKYKQIIPLLEKA